MTLKKKTSIILTLGIVAVVYYAMVRLNLFVCDDFRYAFIQGTNKPIRTIADAINSQCHAYMFENGRFIVHTLVQCFAGIWGMEWLRIFNTLFFIVFVWCTCLLVNNGKSWKISISSVMFVCIMMLFAIPVFGYSFLGNIACSINYLWTGALSLAFLCVLNYYSKSKYNIVSIGLCLCAAIIGAMQESFSIGLSVGVFVWMLINRKRITPLQVALVIFYCIGSAIVILAPSNFLREAGWNSGSTSFLMRTVSGACSVLLYCHTMVAMCVCLIVGCFVSPAKMKCFCKENICYLITIGLSAIFVACVAFTGPHQLVSIEMFSAIVLLNLIMKNRRFNALINNKRVALLLCIILISLCIPIYYYRYQVKCAYEEMINSARNSTDECMIGGDYDNLSFGERNFFVKNYTSTELNLNIPMTSLSMYLSCGENSSLISTRLPQNKKEIIAICSDSKNAIGSNVYHRSGDCFYIIKSADKHINIIMEEELNWKSNLRAKLLSRAVGTQTKTVDATSLNHFNDGEYNYYIVYDSEAYPIIKISVK